MKKNDKKLSVRERKLVKALLEGQTAENALILAGYSKETARAQAKKVIGRNRIQRAIEKELEKQGISNEFLAKGIKEGLEATKFVSDGQGELIEVPDFNVRHRYLDLVFRLRGDYAPIKQEHSGRLNVESEGVISFLNWVQETTEARKEI